MAQPVDEGEDDPPAVAFLQRREAFAQARALRLGGDAVQRIGLHRGVAEAGVVGRHFPPPGAGEVEGGVADDAGEPGLRIAAGGVELVGTVGDLDEGVLQRIGGGVPVPQDGIGDAEQAHQTLAMIPPGSTDPDVMAVRAQLALGEAPVAAADGATADLKARLQADPADHQARHDLAQALAAQGDFAGAVDQLIQIVQADREWNDQLARKTLLTVFDAAGPGSDVARDGRRRLSSILFS